jgi:hypothetical protein
MTRAGLNMDLPGPRVSEPSDVASRGFAHIADGRIVIVKGYDDAVLSNSGHNRAELFLESLAPARKLLPPSA